MTDFESRRVASSNSGTATSRYAAEKPFPFEARHRHLAEEFMRPYLRDLAKDREPQRGLDPLGWTICRFMWFIADFQARRLARAEMLRCNPPEATWLYRDLYQLDRACDPEGRINVAIPEAAMEYFDIDGETWFRSWHAALHSSIGRDRALGRRPQDQPPLRAMEPRAAHAALLDAGWTEARIAELRAEMMVDLKGMGTWKRMA